MNLSVENRIAQPVGITLERYIMRKQAEFPFATGELSQQLRDIALAGKIVNRAGLTSIIGSMGQQNVQGEAQQKLDVEANIRFIRALTNGGEACAVLSEEEDDIIHTGNCQGKYVVAIDRSTAPATSTSTSVSAPFSASTGACRRWGSRLVLRIFCRAGALR